MQALSKQPQRDRSAFVAAVRRVVAAIPRGSVLSYGAVAKRAGFPGAARAVGTLMKGNLDRGIPCHRVVRADGSVGEYNRGGSQKKAALLRQEGVVFVSKERVKL